MQLLCLIAPAVSPLSAVLRCMRCTLLFSRWHGNTWINSCGGQLDLPMSQRCFQQFKQLMTSSLLRQGSDLPKYSFTTPFTPLVLRMRAYAASVGNFLFAIVVICWGLWLVPFWLTQRTHSVIFVIKCDNLRVNLQWLTVTGHISLHSNHISFHKIRVVIKYYIGESCSKRSFVKAMTGKEAD